jgi:hypothetical protein
MRNYLNSLINRNVQTPTRQIAGMSGNEQTSQDILSKILAGETFADPRISPYYQGLRQEINTETEKGVAALNRRGQSAGMYNSTPAARAEGDYRADMSAKTLSILGGLYETERNRDNPYTRLQAGMTYGSLPRQLEQEGMNAGYESSLQDILFPYQYQAPLAQNMLNYQPWYQPQYYQQPSMFSQIAGPAGQLAGGVGMLAMASDVRLKSNISYINGGPWATWTWNKRAGDLFGLKGQSFGLIAQDVEQWNPAAIKTHASGYKMINYSIL